MTNLLSGGPYRADSGGYQPASRYWRALVFTSFLTACFACVERESDYAHLDDESPYYSHDALSPVTLTGSMLSDAPAIGQPTQLMVHAGKLWVSDMVGDPGIHAVDASSGRLVVSLARRGEGPGDVMSVSNLSALPHDTEGIWVYDFQLRRFTRLEPRAPADYVVQTIQLSTTVPILRSVWLDANRIVGMAADQAAPETAGRFVIFDRDGNEIERIRHPLPGADTVPAMERLKVGVNATLCSDHMGKGFVLAYRTFGRLEHFASDGRFERRASVPFPSDPSFVFDDRRGAIVYRSAARRAWYLDCAVTSDRVYALFSGRSRDSYSGDDAHQAEFVHVFDRVGNLVGVLHLDRPALAISVDADDGVLFTASPYAAGVYRFILPESGR